MQRLRKTFDKRLRDELLPAFKAETEREPHDLSALEPAALVERFHFWTRRTLDDFARESLKPTALAALAIGNVVKVVLRFRVPVGKDLAASIPGGQSFIHAPGAPVPTWWTFGAAPTRCLMGWVAGLAADRFARGRGGGAATDRLVLAAVRGLASNVLPFLPWRPSKFRLLVLTQYWPGFNSSPFIAMHILHPGSLHSAPASRNTLWSLSASAASLTS